MTEERLAEIKSLYEVVTDGEKSNDFTAVSKFLTEEIAEVIADFEQWRKDCVQLYNETLTHKGENARLREALEGVRLYCEITKRNFVEMSDIEHIDNQAREALNYDE